MGARQVRASGIQAVLRALPVAIAAASPACGGRTESGAPAAVKLTSDDATAVGAGGVPTMVAPADDCLAECELGALSPELIEVIEKVVDKGVDQMEERDLEQVSTISIPLQNIEGIQCLKQLEQLELMETADLSPLNCHPSLKSIRLTLPPMDLTPLRTISTLKEVALLSYWADSLDSLRELETLEKLSLFGVFDLNTPHDLQGFGSLRSLSIFDVEKLDYSTLSGLSHLEELQVVFHAPSDLSVLSELKNLRTVSLAYIPATDLSPIPPPGALPARLSLAGMNLDAHAIDVDIPSLVDAGWCVRWSNPIEADEVAPEGCWEESSK